jgi:hypothetical protein
MALTLQGKGSDEDSDLQKDYRTQSMLKSDNLYLLAEIPPANGGLSFYDLLQTADDVDRFPSQILQMLDNSIQYST